MKNLFLAISILSATLAYSQSLPIDFESDITTSDFVDFDGGTATVIANPDQDGINTSSTVAQIVRDGGQVWGGSKIVLASNLDFSTDNVISMKVYTTAAAGTTFKFKLESAAGSDERDVQTTVSGEWETLVWDFTGAAAAYSEVVFMFDFGNVGDGSSNSTVLIDDVMQEFGGLQIDFPVGFEGSDINYTVTDFGGNQSQLVADPTDPNNTVVQTIKTSQAATWAGTTIGTQAGFATNLPLTLADSHMNVMVWSPTAGTPIRLKVEDSNDPTHTCETQTNTTIAGGWEQLEFDFSNEAAGTASLSVGLSMGWTYNKASIFFNFDTEGAVAGEMTYYFDDVQFGESIVSTDDHESADLISYPNPTVDRWTVESTNTRISKVEIYDVQGRLCQSIDNENSYLSVNVSAFSEGIYWAKVYTDLGVTTAKLLKI